MSYLALVAVWIGWLAIGLTLVRSQWVASLIGGTLGALTALFGIWQYHRSHRP